MKGKIKYLAIIFAFVLVFCGIFFPAKINEVYAAEFSYQENRDGFSYTKDGKLKVTFTVSSMEDGLSSGLINWGVYFIDPNTGITYNASTHKYEDNNNRQRHVADYYFIVDPNDAFDQNGNQIRANYEGTFTIYVDGDAVAYHATTQNPSSSTDMGTSTNKTLNDVIQEKDWIIGVGPIFANWWTSGYSAPIDYYVGRQSELQFTSTIYYRDFDGTLIDSTDYAIGTNENVDTSDVNFTADANKVFTGWYCDVTKQTYANFDAIEELSVASLVAETGTANFYATYQRGNGKYIEFTPIAQFEGNYTQDSLNDTILLENTDNNTTFSVVYKITHNDGVNSILLLPEYDETKFSIVSLSVDNETALNAATLTNGGYDKILFESENTYSDLNDAFITITFNIDNPVDGDYKFGLKLVPFVHNDVSEAYYYLDGNNLGEQEEIDIRVVETSNTVRVLTYKDAEIEANENYIFTYNKQAVTTAMSNNLDFENLVVKFVYNGDSNMTNSQFGITWYENTFNSYNEKTDNVLDSAPISAVDYYGQIMAFEGYNVYESFEYNLDLIKSDYDYYKVTISAPAQGMYHATSKTVNVFIKQKGLTLSADNKSSGYGEEIVPLTHNVSGVVAGDNVYSSASTTATSSSDAGTYPINVTYSNTNYYPASRSNGTYTIVPKAITITALDQNAPYTGSEPTVSQTAYTVSGVDSISGVVITKEAGVNVGEYTLTPYLNNSNYNPTYVNAKFYITSVGLDAEYIKSFFSGDTVTYDANSHNLLIVANDIPSWISENYTASNNVQTNANSYTISIAVNFDAQTASNYTAGVQEFNLTVTGVINPYALTITADNKTSQYGMAPASLTPTTVEGVGEDVISVSFTVKDGEETIVLSASTNVGEYSIVPSATNTNYNFTFVNGTYSVTKATPVVSVSAEDISYNRALNYTHSASVNTLELNNYLVVIKDSNNNVVDTNSVLDAGEYTVVVSVEGTDNYNSASSSATFVINKIALKAPIVSYNKATATWTAVTQDEGDVELYNATVSYKINTADANLRTFTANSTDALTLYVNSSNDNYLSVSVNLENVYSVTFAEGNHSQNTNTPENMPAVQYLFSGETAVEPQTNPTLTGYTFVDWDFNFGNLINSNTIIPAIWEIDSFTVTFKFTDTAETSNVDMFAFTFDYKDVINYSELNLVPVKASENDGFSYSFNGEWINLTDLLTYITDNSGNLSNNNEDYVVTADVTFVAQYNVVYNSFRVTYYVSQNGGEYVEFATPTEVVYNDEINYESLSANIHWFKADAWYLNGSRTEAAPRIMPNHNIDVYGAIVFDIGQGDVNGDGNVDVNDITLYRQWIVGGYEMSVVNINDEWATAQEYNDQTNYFIFKVADNNTDASKDIRDISIARMALVGGYNWDIESAYNVSGKEIIRNVRAATVNAISSALADGKKVTLAGDITEANGTLNISTNKNVYINLNGKTLTIKSLNLVSTGYSTITVVNGTIVTEDGITISAPNGNVVLTDVIGYDADGEINLAAANHSLHINGVVEFRCGNKTESEPAEVNVEKGTHIVIEEAANIVVEKLVVTENFVATNNEDAVITLSNFSAVADEIEIQGNVVDENTIDTLAKLIAAANKGGSYTLGENLTYSGQVVFTKDTTLNLNGKTLRSTNDVALSASEGATLTISGNGNVVAQEACVMAFGGSTVIINGGEYTAIDNFVFGTNGTSGRGENTIIINNGTFNGTIQSAGYVACGVYVANDDVVLVNGGTFNITNGVGVLARSGNTTISENVTFNVTGNGTLGKVGDSKVTVPSGEIIVLDRAAGYPGGIPTLTNNSAYSVYIKGNISNVSDLAYAITNGGNYKLTADVTYSGQASFSKDTTIDLNGKTLRSTNDVALSASQGATLTISGNGNVVAQEACVMAFSGSTVIINGGNYTAIDNFVFGTNGTSGKGENTIIINNGTFNGTIQSAGYVACGVYVANDDVVLINGGAFNITNGVGVLARSGNTTISENVTFNVTGNGTLGKVGDSRVVIPSGEIIVVDNVANYPGGAPSLTNNSAYSVYTVDAQ